MIGVIGSGSWATAIAKIFSETHPQINWWVREQEIAEELTQYGRNPIYLSQAEFDTQRIYVSTSLIEIIEKSDDLVFVVPAAYLSSSLKNITAKDLEGKYIHSAIKGIIPESNEIVADYFRTHFNVDSKNISIISGPSHAEESAQDKLTFLTVASLNSNLAKRMSEELSCRYVKTAISDDITGISYAAVMKNIYAIATGICRGLGYGDNFTSVLISNAIQEMERFVHAITPLESRNLTYFPYLGDLLVTAYSSHSRNLTFGKMIGNGYSVAEAQMEMKMVAEGYYATNCIHKIRVTFPEVKLPIFDLVYTILYQGQNPRKEVKKMEDMLR